MLKHFKKINLDYPLFSHPMNHPRAWHCSLMQKVLYLGIIHRMTFPDEKKLSPHNLEFQIKYYIPLGFLFFFVLKQEY